MDSYKTKAQILEAKDEEATEAKIQWAMSLGQGTVDDPKGWHYDPLRNCQPVFLYVENMEHDWQMTKTNHTRHL